MAVTISISGIVNGQPANASEVAAAFNALTAYINGNILNDSINASAAIVESKILFNAAGHKHEGATDGSELSADAITSDELDKDRLPLAVDGGDKGALVYEDGEEAAVTADGGDIRTVAFGATFAAAPMITAAIDVAGSIQKGSSLITNPKIYDITNTGFKVINSHPATTFDIHWWAIGI